MSFYDRAETMARTIVYNGRDSLSYSEEDALASDPVLNKHVMGLVDAINENVMKEKRVTLKKGAARKKDAEVLSKVKPIIEISDDVDTEYKCYDSDLMKKSILIVDDEENDLNTITGYLSELNCHIYKATNAKDAARILNDHPIDLLITDIVFPMYCLKDLPYKVWKEKSTTEHSALITGRSTKLVEEIQTKLTKVETNDYHTFAGFKLLDDVRKSQPWLPVIIMTQFNETELIRKAVGSQIQDILIKSVHFNDREEVLFTVKKHLRPAYRSIMAMHREELVSYLETADEKTFTLKILIPLFYELGYRGIRYVHGPDEDGLDLLFYDIDKLGKRQYVGIQVKAENITKTMGQSSNSIINITQQILMAFGSDFYILSEKESVGLEHMYVITSKSFTREAQKYIKKDLIGQIPSQHIDFWDREDVIDQVSKLKRFWPRSKKKLP